MHQKTTALLRAHLPGILSGDGVAVPDDEEEMNWRLFFAHSQDMQGFRADIFTGGPNEDPHPTDPTFVGLRGEWGRDSRSLIADLADVWDDPGAQEKLKTYSNPLRPRELREKGVRPILDLLRTHDNPGAQTFARVLDRFSGYKIGRKTNSMIRAYIQNSHTLRAYDCSFRAYLRRQVMGELFPPVDVVAAEKRWLQAFQRDFYGVGPALANYLMCDWLFWLWREGRIDWFESYKLDSVHLKAVENGWVEDEARKDFVAFCRTLFIPEGLGGFSGRPCPPRLLNECIWLKGNGSTNHRVKYEQPPELTTEDEEILDQVWACLPGSHRSSAAA
jgi:hypothetical protein